MTTISKFNSIDPRFDKYNGDEKLRGAMRNPHEYRPKKDFAPTEQPKPITPQEVGERTTKVVKKVVEFFKGLTKKSDVKAEATDVFKPSDTEAEVVRLIRRSEEIEAGDALKAQSDLDIINAYVDNARSRKENPVIDMTDIRLYESSLLAKELGSRGYVLSEDGVPVKK